MNKRATILYIHHGKGLGGAPISLVNLVREIAAAGFSPVVAFLHDSQAITLFKDAGLSTLPPLNLMDFPHTKIYWFRWYQAHRMLRCLFDTLKTIFIVAPQLFKLVQPEIIHLNTSSLLGWGIAAWWLNIPVVWHIREPIAKGYFGLRKKIIITIIKFCATKIVAICKSDGIPWQNSNKLCVVYNAVNAKLFASTQTSMTSAPTILFLGGLSKQKGSLFILEVFQEILRKIPTAKLIIAGDTSIPNCSNPLRQFSEAKSYDTRCRNLINRLHNSLVLTGPTTAVPELFRKANVLVFPAGVDHFARPVIEAGFMHVPAVASLFPQLEELIIDKKTGLLLPFGEHKAWVYSLCQLLQQQELRARLSTAAYDFCTSKFSLTTQVEKIHTIYETILG